MKAIMRTVTILLFLTAFLVVSSPRSAQAATCTWKDGTTGDWNVAANWNNCNGLVPGVSDEAIISSGTVNVTEDASVGSLTMSGGTLTGDHSLTAGTINWSGGTMSGSGSTTATDEANFTGSYPLWLSERTFNNIGAATLSMTSVGRLDFNASAVFNNQAGATFTVESAGADVVSGSGTFNNAGTFTKASLGETQNAIQFNNSGAVRIESGTLAIWNNDRDSTSTGTYHVASGATLRLQPPRDHNLSGDINATGEGTIEIIGTVNVAGTFTFPGTITIRFGGGSPGGTLNLSTETITADIGILNLSRGTVTGPGHLTASTINWSEGTMSGSGSTTATGEANFTGSYPLWLSERTFNNVGVATLSMTSVGRLDLTASAVFNNQAGATFTVESAGVDVVSGSGTFNNAGTLNLTTGKISAATFVQEPGGITNLTIKGNTPVTDYCQINASAVDLASPLNIGFSGGFTPHIGDEFILLSYGSTRIGDFSPVNVTPLADGFWSLFYEGNSLHLLAEEGQLYIVYLPLVVR